GGDGRRLVDVGYIDRDRLLIVQAGVVGGADDDDVGMIRGVLVIRRRLEAQFAVIGINGEEASVGTAADRIGDRAAGVLVRRIDIGNDARRVLRIGDGDRVGTGSGRDGRRVLHRLGDVGDGDRDGLVIVRAIRIGGAHDDLIDIVGVAVVRRLVV